MALGVHSGRTRRGASSDGVDASASVVADGPDIEGPDDSRRDDLALGGGPLPETALMGASPHAASVVNARNGLNMRAGPGVEYDPPLRLLPFGSPLHVIGRSGNWAQVDLQGDGAADGFVLASFLKAADAAGAFATTGASVGAHGEFRPITSAILQRIMDRCAGMHVTTKLNIVSVADALNRSMILAEANTILREAAFLSQAVIETDYFRTFTEYGKGKGKKYSPYYGRGIHQLTWKDTYDSCSKSLFNDDRLVKTPDLIVNDIEINIKTTAWFWKEHKKLNKYADASNIDEIIYRLYGGRITSAKSEVRRSVVLRRGYYTSILAIVGAES